MIAFGELDRVGNEVTMDYFACRGWGKPRKT